MKPPRRAVELLQSTFERRPDPYEGADLDASRRVLAALMALSALLSLAFLPLEPVDDQIGWAGWLVAAALILVALAGVLLVTAYRMVERHNVHAVLHSTRADVAVFDPVFTAQDCALLDALAVRRLPEHSVRPVPPAPAPTPTPTRPLLAAGCARARARRHAPG